MGSSACGARQDTPFLAEDSGFLEQDPPFLVEDPGFLEQDSPFLVEDSGDLEQDSPLLAEDSGVLEQDSPFLVEDSGVLEQDSPFLAEDSGPAERCSEGPLQGILALVRGSRPGLPLQAGDIYAVPLPANTHGLRYAAVRILAANRPDPVTHPQHLVALTRFVGADLPEIHDPALLDLLRPEGLRGPGAPVIVICCGALPRDTLKIGHRPLSAEEQSYPFHIGDGRPGPDGVVSGFPLVGPIDPVRLGRNVWSDWRWKNDRAALETETAELHAEAQRRRAERVHVPRKPMPAAAFWELIGQLDWAKTGDDDAVIAPLVKALASRGVAAIQAFEEKLAHLLYLLDTRPHAEQIGESAWTGDETHFSVDTFLYARCAAVANGRAFFERALAEPAAMPKDLELEALLSVAGAAYEKRTSKEWDYQAGCDYETFSNRKGWA